MKEAFASGRFPTPRCRYGQFAQGMAALTISAQLAMAPGLSALAAVGETAETTCGTSGVHEICPCPGAEHTQAAPLDLDLTSTIRSNALCNISSPIAITQMLADGTTSVRTIEPCNATITGGTAPSCLVTPAEHLAASQVLAGIASGLPEPSQMQTLVLSTDGSAINGGADITSLVAQVGGVVSKLVVPEKVSLRLDFHQVPNITVQELLDVRGALLGYSSNAATVTGVIQAAAVHNHPGAIISTDIAATSGDNTVNATVSNLDLTISAVTHLINEGEISSSGALRTSSGTDLVNMSMRANGNLVAEAARVLNQRTIAAALGDISVIGSEHLRVPEGAAISASTGSISIGTPHLTNDGQIAAREHVTVGAPPGSGVTIDGNGTINGGTGVAMESADGSIQASQRAVGGIIDGFAGGDFTLVTADIADAPFADAVNNITGTNVSIARKEINVTPMGSITATGKDGIGGTINLSGEEKLELGTGSALAANGEVQGGEIHVASNRVVLRPQVNVNANGLFQGGKIQIQSARSTENDLSRQASLRAISTATAEDIAALWLLQPGIVPRGGEIKISVMLPALLPDVPLLTELPVIDATGPYGGTVELRHFTGTRGMSVSLDVRADGLIFDGGRINITSASLWLKPDAVISTDGQLNGGQIRLTSLNILNTVHAKLVSSAGTTGSGGLVELAGKYIDTGSIRTTGLNGGQITAKGESCLLQPFSIWDASGMAGGGTITVNVSENFDFRSAYLTATGNTARGGELNLIAKTMRAGNLDVSGRTGGVVCVGCFSADPTRFSDLVSFQLSATSSWKASGLEKGGTVTVAANEEILIGEFRQGIFAPPNRTAIDVSGAEKSGSVSLEVDWTKGKWIDLTRADIKAEGGFGIISITARSGYIILSESNLSVSAAASRGGGINLLASEIAHSTWVEDKSGVLQANGATDGGNVLIQAETVDLSKLQMIQVRTTGSEGKPGRVTIKSARAVLPLPKIDLGDNTRVGMQGMPSGWDLASTTALGSLPLFENLVMPLTIETVASDGTFSTKLIVPNYDAVDESTGTTPVESLTPAQYLAARQVMNAFLAASAEADQAQLAAAQTLLVNEDGAAAGGYINISELSGTTNQLDNLTIPTGLTVIVDVPELTIAGALSNSGTLLVSDSISSARIVANTIENHEAGAITSNLVALGGNGNLLSTYYTVDLAFEANRISNAGLISGSGALAMRTETAITNAAAAIMEANGHILLQTPYVVNPGEIISRLGDISINTGSCLQVPDGGSVESAQGNVSIVSPLVMNDGRVQALLGTISVEAPPDRDLTITGNGVLLAAFTTLTSQQAGANIMQRIVGGVLNGAAQGDFKLVSTDAAPMDDSINNIVAANIELKRADITLKPLGSIIAMQQGGKVRLTADNKIEIGTGGWVGVRYGNTGGIIEIKASEIRLQDLSNVVADGQVEGGQILMSALRKIEFGSGTTVGVSAPPGGEYKIPLKGGSVQIDFRTSFRMGPGSSINANGVMSGGTIKIIEEAFADPTPIELSKDSFLRAQSVAAEAELADLEQFDTGSYPKGGRVELRLRIARELPQIDVSGPRGGTAIIEPVNSLNALVRVNANGSRTEGGSISIKAFLPDAALQLESASYLSANGARAGGSIELSASHVDVSRAAISATSVSHRGGTVNFAGNRINTGNIDVSGLYGGTIVVDGGNLWLDLAQDSIWNASGRLDGGIISIKMQGSVWAEKAQIVAKGMQGAGGAVTVSGEVVDVRNIDVSGRTVGGTITSGTEPITRFSLLDAGTLNASGGKKGGQVSITALESVTIGLAGGAPSTITASASGSLWSGPAVFEDYHGGRVELVSGRIVLHRRATITANGFVKGGSIQLVTRQAQLDDFSAESSLAAQSLATAADVLAIKALQPDLLVAGGHIEILDKNPFAADINQLPSANVSGASGGSVRILLGGTVKAFVDIRAEGRVLDGGTVDFTAFEIQLLPDSRIAADGQRRGGTIALKGSTLDTGVATVTAQGLGDCGGTVSFDGFKIHIGNTDVSGVYGGKVTTLDDRVFVLRMAGGTRINVSGSVRGGLVALKAGFTINLMPGEAILSNSQTGRGGDVVLDAVHVSLGYIDVSGQDGGNILIGLKGTDDAGGGERLVTTVLLKPGASLNASGTDKGGNVTIKALQELSIGATTGASNDRSQLSVSGGTRAGTITLALDAEQGQSLSIARADILAAGAKEGGGTVEILANKGELRLSDVNLDTSSNAGLGGRIKLFAEKNIGPEAWLEQASGAWQANGMTGGGQIRIESRNGAVNLTKVATIEAKGTGAGAADGTITVEAPVEVLPPPAMNAVGGLTPDTQTVLVMNSSLQVSEADQLLQQSSDSSLCPSNAASQTSIDTASESGTAATSDSSDDSGPAPTESDSADPMSSDESDFMPIAFTHECSGQGGGTARMHTRLVPGAMLKHLYNARFCRDKDGVVKLIKGQLLVCTQQPTTIRCGQDLVFLAPGTTALLRLQADTLSVVVLHDKRTDAVQCVVDKRKIGLNAGEELIITSRMSDGNHIFNDGVGRRRVKYSQLGTSRQLVSSEVSPVSLMQRTSLLSKMRTSNEQDDRRIMRMILKTAACLTLLTAKHGPYLKTLP